MLVAGLDDALLEHNERSDVIDGCRPGLVEHVASVFPPGDDITNPNAVKVVIPNAGHASNQEQPDAFNTAVRAFLQVQQDASSARV